MANNIQKERFILSEKLRSITSESLKKIGATLDTWGISANLLTLLGFLGHIAAAYLVSQGLIFLGGIVMAFSSGFDALDGAVARASGKSSSWGAFFDSFTDRYAEILLMGGLLVYFLNNDDITGVLVSYTAITGSLMVSYARARAHSLEYDIRAGLFSRFERYLVLFVSLILQLPFWGLVIISIGSHLTALQRAYHFFKNNQPE